MKVNGNVEARKQHFPATKNLQAEGNRVDKKTNEVCGAPSSI